MNLGGWVSEPRVTHVTPTRGSGGRQPLKSYHIVPYLTMTNTGHSVPTTPVVSPLALRDALPRGAGDSWSLNFRSRTTNGTRDRCTVVHDVLTGQTDIGPQKEDPGDGRGPPREDKLLTH